jgi:CheY-like chemotaxis protein
MSSAAQGADQTLAGRRVLVVEDEVAISLLLEDMLLDIGCEVVGPAGRLSAAAELASKEQLDFAVLDVNLAGQPIYPVAEALAARGVPFVFSTGYGSAGIEEPYRNRPVLQKPFAQKVRTSLSVPSA